MNDLKPKYLAPGTYRVWVKVRATVTIEEGEKKTEVELVDDVVLDPGSETVDWEIA